MFACYSEWRGKVRPQFNSEKRKRLVHSTRSHMLTDTTSQSLLTLCNRNEINMQFGLTISIQYSANVDENRQTYQLDLSSSLDN